MRRALYHTAIAICLAVALGTMVGVVLDVLGFPRDQTSGFMIAVGMFTGWNIRSWLEWFLAAKSTPPRPPRRTQP